MAKKPKVEKPKPISIHRVPAGAVIVPIWKREAESFAEILGEPLSQMEQCVAARWAAAGDLNPAIELLLRGELEPRTQPDVGNALLRARSTAIPKAIKRAIRRAGSATIKKKAGRHVKPSLWIRNYLMAVQVEANKDRPGGYEAALQSVMKNFGLKRATVAAAHGEWRKSLEAGIEEPVLRAKIMAIMAN